MSLRNQPFLVVMMAAALLACGDDDGHEPDRGPVDSGPADSGPPSKLDAGMCTSEICAGNCDWREASEGISPCEQPVFLETHLARCGRYDAIVEQGVDSWSADYYDRTTGKLVGDFRTFPVRGCRAFDPSFTLPAITDCEPLESHCICDTHRCVPGDGDEMDAGR